jgi:acetoin utilization protein AcuB
MYITDYMVPFPVTIRADVSIPAARELLRYHNFRHLPVVDKSGGLVGMITDRDLRSAYPSTILTEEERQQHLLRLSGTPVSEIMSRSFVSLQLLSTLDDALLLFDRQNVGALPVLDDAGKVVGIFSIRDLMKAYRQLFGLGEEGSFMIEIEDDGQPQVSSRIIQALEKHDFYFTRLVQPTGVRNDGSRPIYLRIHTYNIRGVHHVLKDAGFSVRNPQPASQ